MKLLNIMTLGFNLMFFSVSNLTAAIIPVGPPPKSIQAAIDLASDGDTVELSAGTYVGQEVKIVNKSINLIGQGRDVSIIEGPDSSNHLSNVFTFGAFNYYSVVMVDNQNASSTSQIVNISNLTVSGSNQQDTTISPIYSGNDRFSAIGFHNANGTVDSVRTTKTRATGTNESALTGIGIANASDIGVITFNITNTSVDEYQRNGIDLKGSALTAYVNNSKVSRGYIAPSGISAAAPIGIEFSTNAKGFVTNTFVSGNIGTEANAHGSGILFSGAGSNITASGNSINNNDYGITSVSTGGNLTISNNTFDFTKNPGINYPEGIYIQDTLGLTIITGNTLNQIPGIDMDLFSATNQPFMLSNNIFFGSQIGLLVRGNWSTGPLVTMNNDIFEGTNNHYIREIGSPNNIWPSTSSVKFDGLRVSQMTYSQFLYLLTKIYDKHNDYSLGLVVP